MAQQQDQYPIQLDVDYPDGPLNRFSSFFRVIFIIPIAVLISLIGDLLFFPTLLMILFRQKYPQWWHDWNVALMNFTNRFTAYFFLLMDEYPSTDEEQAVHLVVPYPDVETELNRWLPLVKWILAIPHYIVLAFLGIVALIVLIVAWIAILFTGRYPRGLFDFVVGVMRWSLRVQAYMLVLVTDEYPPFRLRP